ncbi:MAG: hypothetical protein ACK4RK_11745 [Gemmataceae bacterium]
MAQTCTKCSRINPEDAVFCYYDGSALNGHASANGGVITSGSQTFNNQFIFPNGQACRSFDQLALACQQNWSDALNLLQQGYLETFLVGLGRADLGMAAREAARYPDRDRGLDQFMDKLPTDVLKPPQLAVEPTEVNLGQIKVGEDRKLEIHLENKGMRLLYGSLTCENTPWLSFNDTPGAGQKLFQFGKEQTITVYVCGKQLRASSKPLEGRIVVESNGGTIPIVIRAEVPAKAFPEGVLAGAKSPRQAAEKAKASPKEAAAYFENGAVAQWYKDNGWTYPVRGPAASGLGAVQQFFEALGLTPPPKVEVSEKAISLSGNVGDHLRHAIEVKSQEKRPVYAHGVCDQPWLEVGKARLNGRIATIPLVIPTVPNKPSQTLTAKLKIMANGNQRFVIPVTLQVGHNLNFFEEPAAPAVDTAPAVADALTFTVDPAPPSAPTPASEPVISVPSVRRRPSATGTFPWKHAVPAALLLLALLGVLIWDLVKPSDSYVQGRGDPRDPTQVTGIQAKHDRDLIAVDFSDRMRFGIVLLDQYDPENPQANKKLTRERDGGTNNTLITVDGHECLFGQQPLVWKKNERGRDMKRIEIRSSKDTKVRAWRSVMVHPEFKVEVEQIVRIVVGEQTREYDTCLVEYIIRNESNAPHNVALRVLIDTLIGDNDGTPFLVAGQEGLVDDMALFEKTEDIPDFIQALESSDLKNPGTIAQMGLKIAGYESPSKLWLCRWPGNSELKTFDPVSMRKGPKPDSCVVLFWPEVRMEPRSERRLAFTYGLGKVSSTGGAGQLGLTALGSLSPGRTFNVVAYVKNPQDGQEVELKLPAGMSFDNGQTAKKKVAQGGDYTQVSWKVKAASAGEYSISAVLLGPGGGTTESFTIQVNPSSLFQ